MPDISVPSGFASTEQARYEEKNQDPRVWSQNSDWETQKPCRDTEEPENRIQLHTPPKLQDCLGVYDALKIEGQYLSLREMEAEVKHHIG